MRKRLLAALHKRTGPSPPQAPIEHAVPMATQATDLLDGYLRTGQLELLNIAIELLGNAMAATPPGRPDRSELLSSLSGALLDRFERTGELADLGPSWTTVTCPAHAENDARARG